MYGGMFHTLGREKVKQQSMTSSLNKLLPILPPQADITAFATLFSSWANYYGYTFTPNTAEVISY